MSTLIIYEFLLLITNFAILIDAKIKHISNILYLFMCSL